MVISTAVILAGGKGTRLMPYTKNIPKPMVIVNKKPFLFYLIKQLKENSFKKIYILTGYKSSIIEEFFIKEKKIIEIIKTPTHFETAKRIMSLKYKIKTPFLLLYGDNYLNINLGNYFKFYNKNKKIFSFVIKLASESNEIGNINLSNQNIIYSLERSKSFRYVELGFFILDKTIFKFISKKNISFSIILKNLCEKSLINPYITKAKYLSITNKNKLSKTRKNLF